jgi:hypothetical protein
MQKVLPSSPPVLLSPGTHSSPPPHSPLLVVWVQWCGCSLYGTRIFRYVEMWTRGLSSQDSCHLLCLRSLTLFFDGCAMDVRWVRVCVCVCVCVCACLYAGASAGGRFDAVHNGEFAVLSRLLFLCNPTRKEIYDTFSRCLCWQSCSTHHTPVVRPNCAYTCNTSCTGAMQCQETGVCFFTKTHR